MWFRKTPAQAQPGDAAPPFSLPAHDGRNIQLVDFRGKQRVVVAFYPEDETAGQRHELSAFESNLARFKALKTQVVGISQNTTEAQVRLAAKLGLHFPLLSDPPGYVARMYGAKAVIPFFLKKTFVIDGRGVLRLALEGKPKIEQVITYLEGLHGDV